MNWLDDNPLTLWHFLTNIFLYVYASYVFLHCGHMFLYVLNCLNFRNWTLNFCSSFKYWHYIYVNYLCPSRSGIFYKQMTCTNCSFSTHQHTRLRASHMNFFLFLCTDKVIEGELRTDSLKFQPKSHEHHKCYQWQFRIIENTSSVT